MRSGAEKKSGVGTRLRARTLRRKRERELRKQIAKGKAPMARPTFTPKKPIEYGCPKCRVIIPKIEWFGRGTWIRYTYQPTTCPYCGEKLIVINNVKNSSPAKV